MRSSRDSAAPFDNRRAAARVVIAKQGVKLDADHHEDIELRASGRWSHQDATAPALLSFIAVRSGAVSSW